MGWVNARIAAARTYAGDIESIDVTSGGVAVATVSFVARKSGILLWLGVVVVVVVVAAFFAVQQGVIVLPAALSPVERQIVDTSGTVSTNMADGAPKVHATIDAGVRVAAKSVGDVLRATSVPKEKPERYHTPTPAATRGKPVIDVRQLEDRTHHLINAQRVRHGLSPLEHIEKLRVLARSHSDDMAVRGYFSHDSPEGLSPTDRGDRAGYACRKDYGTYYSYGLAENIYQGWLSSSTTYIYGIPFEIAVAAIASWMKSPGHRENILTDSYDKTGIGVAIAGDGKVYFTQKFC